MKKTLLATSLLLLVSCANDKPPANIKSYVLSCQHDGMTRDYRFDAQRVDFHEQQWTGKVDWNVVFVYKQVRVGEVCGTYIIQEK